jgi:hypothetical protein
LLAYSCTTKKQKQKNIDCACAIVGRGEADHQNWKAAKALLVIIPLLGITYLITILGTVIEAIYK